MIFMHLFILTRNKSLVLSLAVFLPVQPGRTQKLNAIPATPEVRPLILLNILQFAAI